MAKITLSPLVTDIRGKVGPVVFSKWKGQNTARALVTPGNPRTLLQIAARSFTYAVSKAWARQSEAYKQAFNDAAAGLGISGNNLFVQRMQSYNPFFRDWKSTTVGAHDALDTVVTVASTAPLVSPSYVDTLGFVMGAKVTVAGAAGVFTVTAVDEDDNTLTLDRPLGADVAAGALVSVAGAAAPDLTDFTLSA